MNVHALSVLLARFLLLWFAGVHCGTGINDRAMETPRSLKSPKKWEQGEGNLTECMSEYAVIIIKSYVWVFCDFHLRTSVNSSAAPSKGIWREVSFLEPKQHLKGRGSNCRHSNTVFIACNQQLHPCTNNLCWTGNTSIHSQLKDKN